ncbi:MAG: anti-sigma factor family protein [Candidatus Rokuibacteriota bacterium]
MRIACWLTRRRLDAYQDGELPPAARTRTAAHLEGCRACATGLAALSRLRTAVGALATDGPELPEAVWQTFWPQVRGRLQTAPAPERGRERWGWLLGHRGVALGSAVAVAAVAVIAFVAPWQGPPAPPAPIPPVVVAPAAPESSPAAVVVQSVETADPESSVMVYSNPDDDMTIVWVFGLERTEI